MNKLKQKNMMNATLIKAFGVCTAESLQVKDIKGFLEKALQKGFIVNPMVANRDMVEFIKSESVNYNSTFYKNWNDMRSRSRLEQLIDQLIHYASTYGTNFQGEAWTLNDNDQDIPEFNTYKVIDAATPAEVVERCFSILTSGIALSQEMVDAIVDYIGNHYLPEGAVIDDIQNREAMVKICDMLDVRPTTAVELVRWMVYKATNGTLLIKDRNTNIGIRSNSLAVNFNRFTEDELYQLSTVFFRFKPIFLAFKNSVNSPIINKLRRMANKNHKPMKESFWQTVLGVEKYYGEIDERVKELNNFKIIALIQTINERLVEHDKNVYFIRNGKAWVKDNNNADNNHTVYLVTVREILYRALIERLSHKSGLFKYPKSIDIACPVSEKKFAGNLPYGSAYKMSNHNYFGIYWRESDGTRDFDLSFNDKNGYKIGWNAAYRNGDDILFSGDMTSAKPDATEVLYFRGGCKNEGTLWCNRFSGAEGSKYRYFMGRQEIDNLDRNYMVDPNTVEFEEWTKSDNAQEMMGVVFDNKIYPCKFGFGHSIVSSSFGSVEKFNVMKRKLMSTLDLKQVLLDAGFTEWHEGMTIIDPTDMSETPLTPDYDFTNMDKDTLIKLFSEE